jgi:hypothetical protein
MSRKSMSGSLVKARTLNAGIAASVLALVFAASPSQGQQSPFTGFAGSWAGTGTIGMSNGTRERIRCRASYALGGGGSTLQQNLRCASDSYRFELNSNVGYSGGNVSGTWNEATRGIGGSISGAGKMSEIRVRADGPGFSANLLLTTRGDRQQVALRTASGDISEVSITLNRTGRVANPR